MTDGAVIVGGSVAGARVARALRQNGYPHPVTIIEAEDQLPYDKPPLSKATLAGPELSPVPLLTAEEAAELDIELRLGVRATRLDLESAVIRTSDGQQVPYRELVVASGVSARRSPWGQPSGVHLLRTLDDAGAVRASLDRGGDVVIIGAGFIGSEVASAARKRGLKVTMVDPLPVPMARLLGEELGGRLTDLHIRHGVDTRFGVGVETITQDESGPVVALDDGSILRATTVVIGIGTTLNTNWLDGSGLALEDGVTCNEFCQAVGQPAVYAVGDTARWHHRRHSLSIRTEHWTNAIEQAVCVAWNITHPDDPRAYQPIEYVWSDQHDWKIHVLGTPDPLVSPTLIDDEAADRWVAFWSSENDEILGGVTVNWSKASVVLRRAMATQGTASSIVDKLTPSEETIA